MSADLVKWIGLIAGLLFGGTPLVSASWVWLKKQILGASGGGLLSAGVVVLTITLAAFGDWQFVSLEGEGLKLELRKAAERIEQLESEVASLNAVKVQVGAIDSQLASLEGRQEETVAIARQVESELTALKPQLSELVDHQSKLLELGAQVQGLRLENDALTRATASMAGEWDVLSTGPSNTKLTDFAKTYATFFDAAKTLTIETAIIEDYVAPNLNFDPDKWVKALELSQISDERKGDLSLATNYDQLKAALSVAPPAEIHALATAVNLAQKQN